MPEGSGGDVLSSSDVAEVSPAWAVLPGNKALVREEGRLLLKFPAGPDRGRLDKMMRQTRDAGRPQVLVVESIGAQSDSLDYGPTQARPLSELFQLVEKPLGVLRPLGSTSLEWVVRLARGLDAMHRLGGVHGEFCVESIVVDAEGPKIVGFGFADGSPQDDQKALGILAAQMLMGSREGARNPAATLVNLERKGLDSGIVQVLTRALAESPDSRWASCGELAGQLELAEESARRQWAAPDPGRPKKSQRPKWVSWAAVAMVGGGLALWAAQPTRPRPKRVAPPTVETRGKGEVQVESEPPGALISVDGHPTTLRTPAIVHVSLSDKHQIEVALPERVSRPRSREILLTEFIPGSMAKFDLLPARALRISSDPPGARVVLNGERVQGVTPLTLPPMEIGSDVSVEVGLAEFDATRETFKLTAEMPDKKYELQPLVEIRVRSTPTQADVFLDGGFVGRTPMGGLKVPGKRAFEVQVRKVGYRTATRSVLVSQLLNEELRVELDYESEPVSDVPDPSAALRDRIQAKEARVEKAVVLLENAEKRFAKLQKDPSATPFVVSQALNRRNDLEEALKQEQRELESLRKQLKDLED